MSINQALDRPFFSVIIPTFNHEEFLKLSIPSVLSQSFKNFELIVVDNSSLDGTESLIKTFDDDRINYLQIDNAGVIARSRNLGIRNSRGSWLAFLDADDLWYPDKLKVIYEKIVTYNDFNVFCADENLVQFKSGNKRRLKYGPFEKSFYQSLLIKGNCLSTSATVVQKSFIEEYNIYFRENPEFITVEDYDFWMMLAFHGAKFIFVDQVLGEYNVYDQSASARVELHQNNKFLLLRNHVYDVQEFEKSPDELWVQIKVRLLIDHGVFHLRKGNFINSAKLILKALRKSFITSLVYTFSKITR